MPTRLAAYIDMLLEPGEEIEWEGRLMAPWPALVITSLVAATLCGVAAAFAIWRDYVSAMVAWMFFFGISLSYCGAAAVYGMRNIAFVLTTQRILICTYLLFINRCTVRAFLPEELAWQAPTTSECRARLKLLRWASRTGEVEALACRTLLPQLAFRLHHEDAAIRRRSAASFIRLGRAAAPFVDDLLKALKSDDSIIRQRVAEALGNSGVASVAASLERLRFDDDRKVANAAAQALSALSLSRLRVEA